MTQIKPMSATAAVPTQGSVEVWPSDFFVPISREEADFLESWVPPGARRPLRPEAIEAYNLRGAGATYAKIGLRFGATRRRVQLVIAKVDKHRALAWQQGVWGKRG